MSIEDGATGLKEGAPAQAPAAPQREASMVQTGAARSGGREGVGEWEGAGGGEGVIAAAYAAAESISAGLDANAGGGDGDVKSEKYTRRSVERKNRADRRKWRGERRIHRSNGSCSSTAGSPT